MGPDSHLVCAFWGLLGGFVYAAPKLSACIYACRQAKTAPWWCLLDFFVGLATGAIAGATLTPWAAGLVGASEAHKLPGVAGLLGLVANDVAPRYIRWVARKVDAAAGGDAKDGTAA